MSILNRLIARLSPGSKGMPDAPLNGVVEAQQEIKALNDLVSVMISTTLVIDQAFVEQIERRVSEESERNSRRLQLRSEALFFLVHVLSRLSFAEFGAKQRARIHAVLTPRVLEVFVRREVPDLYEDDVAGMRSKLYDELMARETEYGGLSYPSVDPLNLPTSVMGLFSDCWGEALGVTESTR